MSERVLVTGGCGFIGSNLVHRLHQKGYEVVVVDDMSNGNLEFLDGLPFRTVPHQMVPGYEESEAYGEDKVLVVTGDFACDWVLNRLRSGYFNGVFHLAANPRVEYSVKYPVETHETNVFKSVALFQAAAKGNAKVIFSSSCAVYGDAKSIPTYESSQPDPNSPYGLQKLECEKYLQLFSKLYGLRSYSLRYFNVYGPRQLGGSPYSTAVSAWAHAAYYEMPLRSDGDGTQTRDMVFVEDVVDVNIKAYESRIDFGRYPINVGTGKSISNNEILAHFKVYFDPKIVNAPWRPGDVMHTQAGNDVLRMLMGKGYEFTDFKDGLKKTLSWWDTIMCAS